jgi:hypothetical protein
MIKSWLVALLFLNVFILSCKEKEASINLDVKDLLHQNQHQLTQVIIYDVFSPPVSSRIYAYTSLAAYEAIRFQDSSKKSLTAYMQGKK